MEYQSCQNQQNIPRKNPFPKASLFMGIAALLSIVTGIMPLFFGSLGILFAILSHRKRKPLETSAFIGVVTSAIGLCISIVLVAISVMILPSALRDPAYRQQLNDYSESMYGITFDEVLEEGYGINLDELLERK